jgi:hypothetical protein
MKTYLGIVTAIILSALVTMMGLAAVGIYACFECDLLKFQESKIAALSDVDTVFLGDSSLGYALDARAFSGLSGRKTVNLALTGYNYGFGGAYALLKQLLTKTRPNNVVIALTPQTYALSIAQLNGLPIRGFLQASRQSPQKVFAISPFISKEAVEMLSKELFDKRYLSEGIDYLRGKAEPLPGYFQQFDYLQPSNDKLNVSTVIESWGVDVTHDYDVFFSKMAQLCHTNGLNCLYMHSTLLELVVGRNRAFIKELGNRIETAGIRVPYKLPIEIPESDIGNTINHVRPNLQPLYTRKFYELLAPLLR